MQKSSLSTDVAELLRGWILEGELGPGERLNEVHLAKRLEVSRTPLREALGQLVAEEFVEQKPRRGFFVRGVSVEEFDQLYAMRRMLDPEALALAGIPDERRIVALEKLNARILAAAGDAGRVIDLDDRWHLMLIEGCPNEILLETIRQFMRRTRRYEHAYMRSGAHVAVAVGDHEEILDALRAGDLKRAVAGLRTNMTSACEPLRRWLQEIAE